MMKSTTPTVWTEAMEDKLVRLWGTMPRAAIARAMGLTDWRVKWKAEDMDLPMQPMKKSFEPLRSDWIAIATQKANEVKIPPGIVLAGAGGYAGVVARWRAWREILDIHPQLSIAGVARVSGFDHTTILYGLRRLNGASPSEVRKARAVGGQPIAQEAA
jgi:hypothetical protein